MSIRVVRESKPKARKNYQCEACLYLLESWGYYGFTIGELRLIVKARRNGYKIIKGDKYLKQVNVCDGDMYTFRAIPEIHDICIKYGAYQS